jgi:hypothetical protein
MPKILTRSQIDQYAVEGATYPIRVLSPDAARHAFRQLEEG